MGYNPNWARWVQASVADHFKTTANSNGFASLVEGLEERTTAFQENLQRLEIRINGPFIQEQSNGFFSFSVEVNFLIFSHMDGAVDSVYRGTNMAGILAERANTPIPVFKYGPSVGDDKTQIGCLILKSGSKEAVSIFHFGEIDSTSRLRQLGVDASYRMEICE